MNNPLARRPLTCRALTLSLLLAAIGVLGMPALATATPAPALCPAGPPLRGDNDGDGLADLLIGQVREGELGSYWLPGDGGPRVWLDGFGVPGVSGDLNGDRCADMVTDGTSVKLNFGTPAGLDIAHPVTLNLPRPAAADPGSTWWFDVDAAITRHDGISPVVVAGSVSDGGEVGYHPFLDVFTLDGAGRPGMPQVIDLAALGVTSKLSMVGDGRVVAVSSPLTDVGSKTEAGAVLVFSFDRDAPGPLVFRNTLTQSSRGIRGVAEKGDWFGSSLALRDGRLAIGVPEEAIGSVRETGLVQPVLWNDETNTYTAYREIHQGTARVPGSNEKGDHFGYALTIARGQTASGSYDIVIGAPYEYIGKVRFAGSVTVANFSRAKYFGYSQNTRRVPGTAEKNDMLGQALGTSATSATTDSLLMAAQGESSRGCVKAGWVARSDAKLLRSGSPWTYLAPPSCKTAVEYVWGSGFGR